MSSPILWGPNNLSNNLQSGTLLNSGTLINYNGQKNYISNGNFENGSATGWSAVGTAVLTNGLLTSVGTGGAAFSATNGGRAPSGTSAPSVVSTGQLSGNYSLSFTTFSNPGEMYISQPYNIDSADQAKVLNISFNYSSISGTVNFSGTSANSYACAVYDLINNQWLPVVGAFNLVQGTGVGLFTGTVQTNSSTVGIQLSVYTPNAPPTPSSLLLDSFVVGPQFIATGPAMSDPVAYTPTIVGMGTVSIGNAHWWRDGAFLCGKAAWVNGTVNASIFSFSLPNNLSIDTTNYSANSQLVGVFGQGGAASTAYFAPAITSANITSINVIAVNGTSAFGSPLAGNAIGTSGNGASIDFRVKISGWSSNTVQSSDSLQQVVVYTAQGVPTSVISTSFTLLQIPTVTDNTGSVSTSIFTAPVTGYYAYSCNVGISISGASSAGAQNQLGAYKNGSTSIASDVISIVTSAAGYTYTNNLTGIIQLNTGDTLQFKFLSQQTTNISFTTGNISVQRISGPAVVQATESVNAVYTSSATTSIADATPTTMTYATKVRDSHNAFSGTTFMCPVSGVYEVTAVVALSYPASSIVVQQFVTIFQTGSVAANYIGTIVNLNATNSAQTQPVSTITTALFVCLAGDQLSTQTYHSASAARSLTGNPAQNYINIKRVGN